MSTEENPVNPVTLPTIEEIVAKVEAEKAPPPPAAEVKDPAPPPAAEPPKEKEPKPDPASSRFGALARREKEVRAKFDEVNNRLKELEAREKAAQERESKLKAAARNPMELLREHGFSYQDATEAVLGNYKEPEPDPVEAKLKPYAEKFDRYETETSGLKAELEKLRNEITMKQQQESLAQVNREIETVLADDSFELTRSMGKDGLDFVRDIMVEYYKANDNRMLDYREACRIAEDYYEKEYLGRLLATKKLKSKMGDIKPPVEATKPADKPATKPTPATLTNDLTTGAGATVDLDSMSPDEAMAYMTRKIQFFSK